MCVCARARACVCVFVWGGVDGWVCTHVLNAKYVCAGDGGGLERGEGRNRGVRE